MPNKRINQHTIAYSRWKEQTQDTFDFSVLVCTAVPTLKRNLKLYEKGVIETLTKADHYGPIGEPSKIQNDCNVTQLREKTNEYKQKLSKYILISNFSFFESYVKDVIDEMVLFHGGADGFIKAASNKADVFSNFTSNEIELAARKLRAKKGNQVSLKATNILKAKGYPFPSDFFAAYGIASFIRTIGNMSAKDIPSVIKDGLHMNLSETDILKFHNTREARNNVAHGKSILLDLTKVTEMSKFLKSIALRLDQHILRYYMISEKHLHVSLAPHSSGTTNGAP